MPQLRYFAAIRAEAGVGEEQVSGGTLAQVLTAARDGRSTRFTAVLSVCSFLVDGAPVGVRDHDSVRLKPSSTVDCLPPFAGG